MSHTLIAIAVPEAEGLVRRHLTNGASARGPDELLAHITVLGPFLPEDQIDDDVRTDLRSFFAAAPGFDYMLGTPETFPGAVVYLPPDPAAPFEQMADALFERYPGCPPYGGHVDEVVVHLSVGAIRDADSERSLVDAGRSVTPLLCRATHARLYRYDGTLQTIDVFPLADPAESPAPVA